MNKRERMDQVDEILKFLNEEQIRCTYGAIGQIIGVPARSVSLFLGDKRPEASWVVNSGSGEPTGYRVDQQHPNLFRLGKIIDSGLELSKALDEWRVRRS